MRMQLWSGSVTWKLSVDCAACCETLSESEPADMPNPVAWLTFGLYALISDLL